jgi:phosphoglycolate phosphatase
MLKKIASHSDIVIQCHDVPDADAIASGFALLRCLKSWGVPARFIYGGRSRITKPSLLWMLRLFAIPLEYVESLPRCGLLVTVDCQYGGGNLRKFEAGRVAVLDHHQPEIPEGPLVLIRPALGSCSTLVWHLMREEGFDFAAHPDVFTALYYGLYTDTNGFAEIRHPLDRDLADFLPVDRMLIRKLKNSALTLEELDVVAETLSSSRLIGDIGVLKARPCDPNILGFSSDIAQQVEPFGSCVAYCHLQAGLKLSIRSAVREVMANELAAFLTRDVGSGGGGMEKAGGYISFDGIAKAAPGVLPDEFLLSRIALYQSSFDLIYCDRHELDFSSMGRFCKKRIPLGYARTADLFAEGSPISIRTLEGDIDTFSEAGTYLMSGVSGEVYPIRKELFEERYAVLEGEYLPEAEYAPVIIDRATGKKKSLLPFARPCLPRQATIVRARELARAAKVFSNWDREKYFHGRAGDFLAAPETDFSDIYIINREIFHRTYDPA